MKWIPMKSGGHWAVQYKLWDAWQYSLCDAWQYGLHMHLLHRCAGGWTVAWHRVAWHRIAWHHTFDFVQDVQDLPAPDQAHIRPPIESTGRARITAITAMHVGVIRTRHTVQHKARSKACALHPAASTQEESAAT